MWHKKKTEEQRKIRDLEARIAVLQLDKSHQDRLLELYRQELPTPLFTGVHPLTSDCKYEVDLGSSKMLFSYWYIDDYYDSIRYLSFGSDNEYRKSRLRFDVRKIFLAYYRTSNGNFIVVKGDGHGIWSLEKIDEEKTLHDYFSVVGEGNWRHMIDDNVHYTRESL